MIITKLTNQPLLHIYNPALEFKLHTDASAIGIGAALFQKEHGVVFPIAYYSRRTTDYESKYHSYDLETLAIVDAVEHFRTYLYGVHFTIFTDCNSVRATSVKKDLHPRVARWWIKLQDYDFSIAYRPGHKMAHVDYLSRNPVDTICVVNRIDTSKCESIRDFQSLDDFCQQILSNQSEDRNYKVRDGLVVTAGELIRYFVPTNARLHIMKIYHDQSSHIGFDKCIAKMKEDLFWPRMAKCLKKYVRNCRACVLGKSHTGRRTGFWQEGEKPTNVSDTWHIDHAGPLVKSHGYTQILVTIDAFSKYCTLTPLRRKTSEDTIKALHSVFELLGKPRRIIADRAASFLSTMFKNFLDDQGIELHHIATGMPRGNGQVERVMRTVFNLMRATLTDKNEKTWITVLPEIEANLNTTVNSTTGLAPTILS